MTKKWQARTKAPTTKDLYYLGKDKGGYNAFTTYNMFVNNGNCTSYCDGRWNECSSIAAKGIICKTNKLPRCDAGYWFEKCTAYPKGQTAKNGAIAVWKNGKSGHVAFVETFDDKYIYCTESGYKHYLWRSCKYPIKNGKPFIAGYTFQGYIYNPDADNNWKIVEDKKTETKAPVDKSSMYSKGTALNLKEKDLFVSATATKSVRKLTGAYYVYDGKKVNGRIRITNSPKNVGKTPMVSYVTGWIKI